jgi:hypothetical protein
LAEHFRQQFEQRRNLIEQQLGSTLPVGAQRNAKKKELDALVDEFETNVIGVLRKAADWEALKPLVVAACDKTFSEEELAGIVAFYKTPAGQAYVSKMPAFGARLQVSTTEAAQALQPEIARLAQQTYEKARRLGFGVRASTPAKVPARGTARGTPAADDGGLIGALIGSVQPVAPPPFPAPPGPPAPPLPPQPIRSTTPPPRIQVDTKVQHAKLAFRTAPVYPPAAKAAHVSGHVILNAIIAIDGTVQSLALASGPPLLVPAAMAAVRGWVYQPTFVRGKPVEVVTQVDVNFTLSP